MNSISPLPPHPYTGAASVSVQVHDVEKNVERLSLTTSNIHTQESKGQLLLLATLLFGVHYLSIIVLLILYM